MLTTRREGQQGSSSLHTPTHTTTHNQPCQPQPEDQQSNHSIKLRLYFEPCCSARGTLDPGCATAEWTLALFLCGHLASDAPPHSHLQLCKPWWRSSILCCQPRDHQATTCRPRPGTPGFMDLHSDTSQVHPLDSMVVSLHQSIRCSVPDDPQSFRISPKYTTSDSIGIASQGCYDLARLWIGCEQALLPLCLGSSTQACHHQSHHVRLVPHAHRAPFLG